MKQKLLFLFFVWASMINAQQTFVDYYSTGKNNDGTLMSAPPPDVTGGTSMLDPDWTVVRPGETTPVTTKTRHTYTGWSFPVIGVTGNTLQSRWITDKDGWAKVGDYYYYSNSFQIPNGATDAKLNLRSISFVRNWTYLVRTDVTPNTEELITQTTWMSDGAKGWLNSRSPEVINKQLVPGATYKIKVRVYTNNTTVTNALNVHFAYSYNEQACSTPMPVINSPVTYCQNVIASPLTAAGSNLQWYTVASGGIGSSVAPTPSTSVAGTTSYYVSQTENGCESARAKIDVLVNAIPNAPIVTNESLIYCQGSTASPLTATGSNLLWYTVASGGTGSSVAPTPSTDTAGTTSYYVSQTVNGCESARTKIDVVINSQPSVPSITITQPNCNVSTGAITVNSPSTGVEYSFDGGVNYQLSNIKSGLIAGTYSIVVKYNQGCVSQPVSAIIIGSNFAIDNIDYKQAPNSYIFYKDGLLPDGNKVDGLYIPVKKAYQMWREGRYMYNEEGNYTPIDCNGIQSSSVYWEDVNGLITSTTIEGSGENAKIKVIVDKTKGEGNASIAFKVNGTIYWTWHIWVTDNPENGSSYGQGFETDISGNAFIPQYMDRNLGATNANFLGNDWHKSGGLTYVWGRKDPFPPLVYKDGSFYEITGDVGEMRHKSAAISASLIPVKYRGLDTGTDNINGNIRYSINHPIDMIVHELDDGTWFSNQEYKTPNSDTNLVETWDLWSDNRKGLNSNANSINAEEAADSKSYELKSEFDPCPNGWRIPSHYGRNTRNNNLNPFGRKNSGYDDDLITQNASIDPVNSNPVLGGIKVYPGIGVDFRSVTDRNIGIVPMSGNYEYYGGSEITYQDQASEGGFITSTYGIGGVRGFGVISDPGRIDISPVGLNKLYINEIGKTSGAGAARCIRDPNISFLPTEFVTQYVVSTNLDNTDYKSWTKEANSYVVMTGDATDNTATDQILKISLNKAYAMQKLYLSDDKEIPSGSVKTGSVVWTSNTSLIKNVKITGSYPDEFLEVTLAAKQKGNAVVAFHKGNNGVWGQYNPDKIMWSWHIWAPVTNPLDEINQVTYTTESVENGGIISTTSGYFINPTKSMNPPLKTIFMDRNLGALTSFPTSASTLGSTGLATSYEITNSGGLHYQWGRKDPMPTFSTPGGLYATVVYKQSNVDAQGNVIYDTVTPITESIFSSTDLINGYSREWNTYKPTIANSKNEKIRKVIKYATENPLSFMYRNKTGNEETVENTGSLQQKSSQVKDWLSDENGLAIDRWGHATEKSPYDPCPSGWRVPDTSTSDLWNGGKGNSPWFYNGVNTNGNYSDYGIAQGAISGLTESNINNLQTEYKYPGFAIIRYTAPASRLGFIFSFSGSKFDIGNIPVTGIRGVLGGNTYDDALWGLYKNNRYRTGLWTSSPADVYSGYALSLDLYSVSTNAGQNGRLATGYGRYPQAGMGVRCVKDTERYMGDLPYTENISQPVNVISRMDKASMILVENKNGIEVYPNPAKDFLSINNNDDLLYEIFDISGKIIQKGEVNNRKINISNLIKGAYLIRFINKGNTVFIKKIIKE